MDSLRRQNASHVREFFRNILAPALYGLLLPYSLARLGNQLGQVCIHLCELCSIFVLALLLLALPLLGNHDHAGWPLCCARLA